MRILLVAGYCYAHGVATITRLLAQGLLERGHEVEAYFYHLGNTRDLFESTCPTHIGPQQRLANVLVRKRFDIVHACSSLDEMGFMNSLKLAGFRGGVLGTHHGHDVMGWPWDNPRFLLSTVSQSAATKIQETFGRRPEVVFNAIDETVFQPHGPCTESDRPMLLWVGRSIDPHKDFTGFLAVASLLVEKGWQACIVDGVRAADNSAAQWFEGDVQVQTNLSPAEMASLYRSTGQSGGCLLMTSSTETFGLAALEAMACGCPVIAPAVGGLPELVSHGRNGILYDRAAGRTVVADTVESLRSSTLRPSIIEGGLETVRNEFSRQSMLDGYEELYRRISQRQSGLQLPLPRRLAVRALLSIRDTARQLGLHLLH